MNGVAAEKNARPNDPAYLGVEFQPGLHRALQAKRRVRDRLSFRAVVHQLAGDPIGIGDHELTFAGRRNIPSFEVCRQGSSVVWLDRDGEVIDDPGDLAATEHDERAIVSLETKPDVAVRLIGALREIQRVLVPVRQLLRMLGSDRHMLEMLALKAGGGGRGRVGGGDQHRHPLDQLTTGDAAPLVLRQERCDERLHAELLAVVSETTRTG
jgi:hypothetical protein